MKSYIVHFYYIDNGREDQETFTPNKDDNRPIADIVNESWRGLLSNSGGLRKVTSIAEIVPSVARCFHCGHNEIEEDGTYNPCICYAR